MMKENKVQTKYEQMRDLEIQIKELEIFIDSDYGSGFRLMAIIRKPNRIGRFLQRRTITLPEAIRYDIEKQCKLKLVELQNEFNELNKF